MTASESRTAAAQVGRRRLGEREFIFFMALLSAMSALAIDMVLPAFAEMRPAFGLDSASTELSLTITLFFFGSAIGNLVYGPVADALGRKPVLAASLALYAVAALAAAVAPSLAVLLTARFVWGFAAAGPRTLTQAIVRDRFVGNSMARVMTLIQAAFFLGPVAAPLIGRGLLAVGSWRWVMGFGVISALTVALWSIRLEETLESERRRPLRLKPLLVGFRSVLGNRVTLGYALSLMFSFGAFFSFLGSSELLFEGVYDKGSWFVPYFSITAAVLAMVAFGTNRLLRTHETFRINRTAGIGLVLSSGLLTALAVTGDGVPGIVAFLVVLAVANGCHVMLIPTGNSLALEPMGALAGTAAGVVGFITSLFGATLASFIDRAVDGTVTPIALGYLGYSSIALALQIWAARGPVGSD